MDRIGWYIATIHQLLGHDKAAFVLGVDPDDKAACVICIYEREPTPERKRTIEGTLVAHTPKVSE